MGEGICAGSAAQWREGARRPRLAATASRSDRRDRGIWLELNAATRLIPQNGTPIRAHIVSSDLTVTAWRCGISADARHVTADLLPDTRVLPFIGRHTSASGRYFLLSIQLNIRNAKAGPLSAAGRARGRLRHIIVRNSDNEPGNHASHTKGWPRHPRNCCACSDRMEAGGSDARPALKDQCRRPRLKAFVYLPTDTKRRPGPLSGIPVAIQGHHRDLGHADHERFGNLQGSHPSGRAWVVEAAAQSRRDDFGKTVTTEFCVAPSGTDGQSLKHDHTPGGIIVGLRRPRSRRDWCRSRSAAQTLGR